MGQRWRLCTCGARAGDEAPSNERRGRWGRRGQPTGPGLRRALPYRKRFPSALLGGALQGEGGGGGGQQPAHPQYANHRAPLTRKRHTTPHSAQSQHTNYWAPRTRKRHQQEHRPQRPTESSDPTQHAKGRTGDRLGPRKGATTRRNVTQGGRACPGKPQGHRPGHRAPNVPRHTRHSQSNTRPLFPYATRPGEGGMRRNWCRTRQRRDRPTNTTKPGVARGRGAAQGWSGDRSPMGRWWSPSLC